MFVHETISLPSGDVNGVNGGRGQDSGRGRDWGRGRGQDWERDWERDWGRDGDRDGDRDGGRGQGALGLDARAARESLVAPRMSKLTEEHRKLHRLAGEWAGEEMIYPSPPDRGGRASARATGRVELDGFFVVTDYVEEREGAPPYLGHGIYGWDPIGRAFTMHWFDSMGSIPTGVARGQWTPGGADGADAELVFEQRTHQGYARYVYRFTRGRDVYVFRIESSRDGRDWKPFMEGKYRRTG